MSGEDDFRIRPGRIRSTRAQQTRPFIAQALAAAQRAGGRVSRSGKISSGNQRATVQANRLLTNRSRNTVIKTRVVRHTARSAPLNAHLSYLQREGVTRDGEKAKLFGPETEAADAKAFAERTQDDRHHFRFIVSPEDATEMSDLKTFARELMGQMETDLGTKLDWVGVDHWNTDNPHVHIILRGRTDDGQDLVISRDYIKEGMRARAQDLVTQELGPRTDHEIRRNLERQIDAERWTNLDRQLARDSYRTGVVDLAPLPDRQPDEFHAMKVGRLRKLETLGLADQVGPGQWVVSENAEATLRELGERGDIIKRIHRGLTERGVREVGPRSAGVDDHLRGERELLAGDLVADDDGRAVGTDDGRVVGGAGRLFAQAVAQHVESEALGVVHRGVVVGGGVGEPLVEVGEQLVRLLAAVEAVARHGAPVA
jgi:type IV secretory pathway VirD2 relaxase